ncbi:hypothetical protein XI06_16420 [Bradyrhizobium sp. CCBAU 11434]|nr:hypothetical protein [Bradyrhizobium sp. CCBAU 11434]
MARLPIFAGSVDDLNQKRFRPLPAIHDQPVASLRTSDDEPSADGYGDQIDVEALAVMQTAPIFGPERTLL